MGRKTSSACPGGRWGRWFLVCRGGRDVGSRCALLFSGASFHPRYRPAHRRSVDPYLPCNLGTGGSKFPNTPRRDNCPSLANPCPSAPRTKLFGGYPMLQALFMNDVSNLLPGVLRPQWPLVLFLRFFQYGIDEITRPKGFSDLSSFLFPSQPPLQTIPQGSESGLLR